TSSSPAPPGGRVDPVNVSGGLESKGHPIATTGIANIWEVCHHLRGESAGRRPGGFLPFWVECPFFGSTDRFVGGSLTRARVHAVSCLRFRLFEGWLVEGRRRARHRPGRGDRGVGARGGGLADSAEPAGLGATAGGLEGPLRALLEAGAGL